MGRGVFLKDQLRSLTQGGEATWFSLLLEPLHAYVRPYSPHNPNARDEALGACICMGSGHHATSPAEHGLSAPEFWDLYSYAQNTWHRTILNLAKCVLRSDMNIRKISTSIIVWTQLKRHQSHQGFGLPTYSNSIARRTTLQQILEGK